MSFTHFPVAQSSAQEWFLAHYEEIRSRTRACFAHMRAEQREEAMAEVVGAVFKAGANAARRGSLDKVTPYHAVVYATRQYREGRRLAGTSSTDAMSEAAQVKGRAVVLPLSHAVAQKRHNASGRAMALSDVLADRRTDNSPYEQARQNIDYAEIFKREHVSRKARRVFRLLAAMRGRGHIDRIAGMLGVTPGRICQLKGQLAHALARHDYQPEFRRLAAVAGSGPEAKPAAGAPAARTAPAGAFDCEHGGANQSRPTAGKGDSMSKIRVTVGLSRGHGQHSPDEASVVEATETFEDGLQDRPEELQEQIAALFARAEAALDRHAAAVPGDAGREAQATPPEATAAPESAR